MNKIDSSEFAFRLKEFYLLEKFQVQYYQSQLSSTNDEYYQKAFGKMVKIESGHADYFAEKLTEGNIEIPKITASIFDVAGRFLGESVEITGPYNTCKLGIALENKAMEMYREFIMRGWADQGLKDTLMEYLIDEEFHKLWMKNYIKTFKGN